MDATKYHFRIAAALRGWGGAGRALTICLASVLALPVLADDTARIGAAYPGRIEALNRADVANEVEGVIKAVHFSPGQTVQAGDPLFTLEPADFELIVDTRRANVQRAEATMKSAHRDFDRLGQLKERGSASSVQVLKAEVAVAVGEAVLAQTRADLKTAEQDLSRTIIRAPISGVISPSESSTGSYIKTGRGPLARIVQLDPVRVSFEIPYVGQLERLGGNNLDSPESLLAGVTLTIQLSDTWTYAETTNPDHLSGTVDFATGTVTVWAEIANPNRLLRPGMRVTVLTSAEPGSVRPATGD